MNKVTYADLGLKDYKETWDFQIDLQKKIIEAKTEQSRGDNINYLLFVEHPHVYTLGKSGKENNLLIQNSVLKSIQASFYKIDRGGDITYHGPGQLVGYPVFDLEAFRIGIKDYIKKLEESIILTLAEFGVASSKLEGATGVWVDINNPKRVRKICAIGVKVSRSVTMHGFALNVNTDLNYFRYINPCGFIDKGVTSLEKELGKPQPMDKVKRILLNNLERTFHFVRV
ncbi:MAG: lipoyl(octanoyl) transferase LipB [Bacteroidales bacterium]|nr:lipoyl(octanoyl) transferase LipB [Bacteroidales bacterium]MBN2762922.1 lipoyl(octanoyl) transferase LipB [Bacteroidales bacterium]